MVCSFDFNKGHATRPVAAVNPRRSLDGQLPRLPHKRERQGYAIRGSRVSVPAKVPGKAARKPCLSGPHKLHVGFPASHLTSSPTLLQRPPCHSAPGCLPPLTLANLSVALSGGVVRAHGDHSRFFFKFFLMSCSSTLVVVNNFVLFGAWLSWIHRDRRHMPVMSYFVCATQIIPINACFYLELCNTTVEPV